MAPRVAVLGNMNNCHFALVRYLRDEGVDADLLLYDVEYPHFLPHCDAFDNEHEKFTRQLAWGDIRTLHRTKAEAVRESLSGYDLCIANGVAPAYFQKAGLQLDVFVPYGSDIWVETFYPSIVHPSHPFRVLSKIRSVGLQRKGIARAHIVHMPPTNDFYDGRIAKLAPQATRWREPVPIVHAPTYARDRVARLGPSTRFFEEFRAIRESSDLMVFHHARHFWGKGLDRLANKGTDILFKGWKLFRTRHPEVRATLVTFEYGRDVADTKRLVSQLGIDDSVKWMPLMERKELLVGLAMADVACDELVNSWIASGVIYEAQIMGKPILAHRDDNLYLAEFPDLYPILHASTPEDVANQLTRVSQRPDEGKRIGDAGRVWHEERVVRPALLKYRELIRGRQ